MSILCFTGRLNANKLLFNMLTLLFFGRVVEQYFALAFGSKLGIVLYVVLYVSAMAVSTV